MGDMDDAMTAEAPIERRMDRDREIILARGDFTRLFAVFEDHVRTWGLHLDPLGLVMMRQALGGVALYLSSRPRNESCAFTLNFEKPATNIFVSGRSEEGTVTGRIFTENVATTGESRLFVQTSRAGGRDFTSVIDVTGLDVLLILEDYCARSEQAPARFFEIGDDDYLMVASLPREDRDWLSRLERDEALKLFEEARPLDHKAFRFHCGCDPLRMQDVIKRMFGDRLDEVFGAEASVEVTCPRCGRRWTLRRDQVDGEDGS